MVPSKDFAELSGPVVKRGRQRPHFEDGELQERHQGEEALSVPGAQEGAGCPPKGTGPVSLRDPLWNGANWVATEASVVP